MRGELMRKNGKKIRRKKKLGSREAVGLPWRSRIVGHEDVDPRVLIENPSNFRLHDDHQRAVMRTAIDRIGFINSVVVNKTTGRIINGHMRVNEAISSGQPTIPVVWVELSEQEEAAALATFDPISELAEVDSVIFGNLLREITADDADVAAVMEVVAEDQGVAEMYFMDQAEEKDEVDLDAVRKAEKFLVVFHCTDQKYAEELSCKISEAGYDCYVQLK